MLTARALLLFGSMSSGTKFPGMQLDLDDEEKFALLDLLTEPIEADRYPLSPRVQTLRAS